MMPDPSARSARSERRRPLAAAVAAAGVVLAAGATGWLLAGSPADGGGTVPPACPAPLAAGYLDSGRGGVPDRLVPVPLPQPRGPIAVRLCRYASGAVEVTPGRSTVLDPPRTAELAGVMDTPGAGVGTGTARPPDCPASGPVTLLLFRYTQGDPLVAEVDGGPCALVMTSARVERGREDVVRLVEAALG